jgi:hypothetical protein
MIRGGRRLQTRNFDITDERHGNVPIAVDRPLSNRQLRVIENGDCDLVSGTKWRRRDNRRRERHEESRQ